MQYLFWPGFLEIRTHGGEQNTLGTIDGPPQKDSDPTEVLFVTKLVELFQNYNTALSGVFTVCVLNE